MKPDELHDLLNRLLTEWENEVVEFKEASHDYSTHDIGKYFSALSNEANLRGMKCAWLVFGVHNKTRAVVGSDYRPKPDHLYSLKKQMVEDTQPNTTFHDIHELHHPDGRVLLFEIPAAPQGMPIAWKGHWYARAGESLTALGVDKLDVIRQQTLTQDWTAQIVPNATLDDLDGTAVRKARASFAQKHANRLPAGEVEHWPLTTFLDRAHLTQNGKLTRAAPRRAALLLLGKDTSSWHLSPHPAQLTLYGGVVDPAYSRLLIQKTDLPLADVLALDRVQKKLSIPDEAASHLRRNKLIEGRKPNYHVSARVAEATARKADYIRTRAQNDTFYAKLLTDYLNEFGQANRREINVLLIEKLSDALTEKQKYSKISNLISKLRQRDVIVNVGSDATPCWQLVKKQHREN